MIADGLLSDLGGLEGAVGDGGGDGLDGGGDFLSGAVVDSEAECHAVVIGGDFFGGGDFLLDGGVKFGGGADDFEFESLLLDLAAFFDEVLFEEGHEQGEFAWGAFPVFAGEAVEGELPESEPGGFFDHAADRLDTAAVTFDAWETSALGPASVAIHDDGDVLGESSAVESEGVELGIGVGGFPGQRRAPIGVAGLGAECSRKVG